MQLVNVIKAHPINVCLACALPHTSALLNPSEGTGIQPIRDRHLDAWLEVCRIAQSVQPRLNVITPRTWKETDFSPIESTQHRHLQGQKIALKPAHAQGQLRTGRILLVTEPPSHRKPRALIHLDQKPEPDTHCTMCKKETPQQNKTEPPKGARACAECNLVFHRKCIPNEHRPDLFPPHDWFCHRCTTKQKTPKGLIPMDIKSAREAIKRYNTSAAKARQEEKNKRTQTFKDMQATCPTTELIEITSSNEIIRTVEKLKLFNGPWLQDDPPENKTPAAITVWRITKNVPKAQGPAKTDQTGMLDTARHTYWNDIHASTPPADNEQEIELARKATAWNTHANLPIIRNINQETRTITTPQAEMIPPTDREHHTKRRQLNHQSPATIQPPTNPPPESHDRPQNIQSASEYTRNAKSHELLANFRHTPQPLTISEHIYTGNDLKELTRTNGVLGRRQPGSKAYQRLLEHRNKLAKVVEIDSLLTMKAQYLNLVPIKVIGDGNCLQYAVNAAHKEQTNHYLANNDDLRLLATALTRAHIKQQTDQPRDIIDSELEVIERTAKNSHPHYPGTYMNALASIRNGPLIVISDVPGECPNIFLPLQEMTDILRGPHTAHGTPGPEDPHLPPIYILHRTTLDPEHFDATKHAAIPPTGPRNAPHHRNNSTGRN
jgi:hypothetical protein